MLYSHVLLRLGPVLVAFAWIWMPTFALADNIETKLTGSRKTLHTDREISFSFAIDCIAQRFDCAIEIDEKAFAAEKRKVPDKTNINVPAIYVPLCLDSVLRVVLPEANAIYEIRKNKIVVLPNTDRSQRRSFPPLTDGQKAAQKELRDYLLKTKVDVEADTEFEIGRHILDFLENHEVPGVVDEKGIGRESLERRIKLPKGKYTLDTAIRKVLEAAGAGYVVEPDYIRIVPATKS